MSNRGRAYRAWRSVSAGLLLAAATTGGCIIKNKKTEAGEGLARLTVRNIAGLTAMLNDDATCGFANEDVVANAVVVGNPGEDGTVTFRVENCTLDAGAALVVSENCNGGTLTAAGKATVTATLTISGLLTGDVASPAVPATADSVVIEYESVSFDGWEVADSESQAKLKVLSGGLAGAKVEPRFAVAADSGACAISTPNLTVSDIVYEFSEVLATNEEGEEADAEIDTSNFSAQVGKKGDAENSITGTMSVLGLEVDVTGDGALDADYDAAIFLEEYACTEGLADPENFECADVRSLLAINSARLSALMYGVAGGIARANTACGFSSANVIPALTGGPGDPDQSITLTLNNPCTITIPDNTVVAQDCNGDTITVGGSFTVTGSSALRGFNTGNLAQPILPDSRQPATIAANISFDGFSISKSTAPATLTVNSGEITGAIEPSLFLDTSSGVCSVASPILGTAPVEFSNLAWTNADVTLDNNGSIFNYTLDTSDFSAQSGNNDANVNTLAGSITFSGTEVAIPAGEPLDEAFDQATFDAAFACALPDGVISAPNEEACSFRGVLGAQAARLLVGATATSVSAGDSICLAPNTTITGNVGQVGSATASATDCPVVLPAGVVNQTDCIGFNKSASGSFVLSGTKNINPGFIAAANVIAPALENAVSFENLVIAMNGWLFESRLPPNSNGINNLAGSVSVLGEVQVSDASPILGAPDDNEDGVADNPFFTKPTPILDVVGLSLANGALTVVLNAADDPQAQEFLLTFKINVTDLDLDVVVGSFAGGENSIEGSLVVDGQTVTLGAGTPFDPNFSQALLDASYSDACVPNTIIPVPPQP